MELTSIIIKPRLTEKTHRMRGFRNPKMSFLVHRKASKHQVAVAFRALFGVSPTSVNTLNRKPVPARFMNKSRYNFLKAYKVAFVTVNTEDFADLQRRVMAETESKDKDIKEAQVVEEKETKTKESKPKEEKAEKAAKAAPKTKKKTAKETKIVGEGKDGN